MRLRVGGFKNNIAQALIGWCPSWRKGCRIYLWGEISSNKFNLRSLCRIVVKSPEDNGNIELEFRREVGAGERYVCLNQSLSL